MLVVLAPMSLLAQATGDSRTVTEPSLPLTTTPASVTCSASVKTNCVCAVLTASQSASSLNQTVFSTTSIQNAMSNISPYTCATGQAVELALGGSTCGTSNNQSCNAFLTGPLTVKGGITLLIDAGVTLFGSLNPADYGGSTCGTINAAGSGCANTLLQVTSANAAIMGYGTIDGQGGQNLVNSDGSNFACPTQVGTPCNWWAIANEAQVLGQNQNNPTMLDLHSGATSFVMYKITLQNSPMFHVTNDGTTGFTAWDVKIIAPYTARNTDGIDPGPNSSSGASNITIANSYISDGDDEIAIKGNHPISNVTISNDYLFTGHGMSIGSETNGPMSNILVENMVMSGVGSTDHNGNGIRIKSNSSEGGTVSNVTYQNICIQNEYNPLIVDPIYTGGTGSAYPYYKSITLDHVHIYNAFNQAIMQEGYNATYPLGMTLNNVQIDGYACSEFTNQTKYAAFTLGPDPVNFSSCLTGTGVTVTNNISTSNAAYTCPPSAFVPLAGELFASASTFSSGSAITLNTILQAMIATYAPPSGGTINILEGSTVVGSATVASNNALAYLLTPISIGTPALGQHTYTAQYTGDPSANYSAGITFGSVTITVGGLTTTTTTVTASPSSPVYGSGNVNMTAAVAPTSGSGTPTGSVTFTVDGTAGSPVSLSGTSAVETLTSLMAGSHTVSAVYGGDTNFSTSSGTDTFSVLPATPVVTVTGGPFTYNGSAQPASCSASANSSSVAGGCTYTYTPGGATVPTNANTYAVNAAFTPGDTTDYASASGSGSIIINAATPTLTVTCAGGAYNASPYSCTGSATGTNGVTAVAGTFAYSYTGAGGTTYGPNAIAPTNAGSYSALGTFTSSDNNYVSGGTTSATPFAITQATPVLTVTCAGGVYNNTPYACTGSATAANGVTPVTGSFAFNPGSETAVGSYPETGTFTSSNPNYASGGTASGTLTITTAAPVLSVTCTGGVYSGNPYSCTGSATGVGGATVAGTFAFNPGSETAVGSYPETGMFTSSNPNYASGGTAPGTLTITTATPALSVTCTGGAYSGNPYSCTGSATGIGGVTVAGTFNCAPASETNAGSYPETCTFTSTNPNYATGGTATGTLIITKFTPVLTATCTEVPYDGNPHSCSGTALGVGGVPVSGTFAFNPVSETNAGSYPETGTFTSTNPNYATGGTASGTLMIDKVNPSLTETCLSVQFNSNPQPCTPGGSATGVGAAAVNGSWTYVYTGISGTVYPSSATAPSAAGSYDVLGTFVSSNGNYNGGTADSSMLILGNLQPLTTSTSLTFSLVSPVFGQSVIATATVSGQSATPTGSVTFVVDTNPGQTVALVNGVANLTLNGLSAITHNIVATYNGDATDATSFDSEQEPVSQAIPTIYPNCYPALYDGKSHGCTPVATGVDGSALAGSWTTTYNGSSSAPSAYTTYQVSLIFTPSDSNYTDNSNSPASAQLLILNPSSEMAIDPGTASIPTWPANPSPVNPQGMATDGNGNLFLADTANSAIDEISIDMYGSGTLSNSSLVSLVSSGLNAPQALTVDPFGDIYVADTGSGTIQMVSGSSLIQITDGLTNPRGITSDADGNIYVSDTGTNTVKLVDVNTGNWIVVAGGGTLCSGKTDAVGDGCPATQATLNGPVGLATDTDGNLYIADTGNQVIRKVTMNTTNPALSVITRVAGIVGAAGLTGDKGPAVAAKLNNPLNIVLDPANMLDIVDSGNSAVRLVDTTGTIKTWMGTLGTPGSDGADGLSVQGVKLSAPSAIALDAFGNVYVSDGGNARTIEDNRNAVTLNLGSVTIGATGKATLSAIVNIGSTTLNFQPPWEYETTTTPGEFAIAGQGACNDSGTLAVGASCNLSAAYAPLASNNPVGGTAEYDTANLDSDASNSLFTLVNLSGTPLTVTQINLSIDCPEVAFDGAAHGCVASATDPNTQAAVPGTWNPLISTLSATNAGTYPESSTFTPTDQVTYQGGLASGTLIINQATPALSVTCTGGVYNANPHACTGSATGVGGATVAGTFAFAPGSEASVGSYPETGTFTSSNPNYASGTASSTLTITTATPVLSVTCTGGVYNGNPYSCTGSAKGVGGATVAGTFAFNPGSETAAGSYPETGTFTSSNTNYASGGTGSGTLTITKATPALSVTCTGGVYNGTPYACTGSATGVGGITVTGSFAFNPGSETAAGSYPETGTFTSTDPNYASGGTASGTLTITGLTSTLIVNCTGGVYNGTPYVCTGLATGVGGVTVSGSFSFTYNASSTAPSNVGAYNVIGTFTSTDPDYASGGTALGTLTITPATPALSLTCTGGVYKGTAYACTGSATGVGGATVAGAFAFNPGSETVVGSYPETGTFTSSNSNYVSGGTASGVLTITTAAPVLSLTCTGGVYDGTTAYSCTGSAKGVGGATVAGTFAFSPGSETSAGSYPETGTFTSSNPNYANGTASGTLTVTGATPALSVTCTGGAYNGTPYSCNGSATGLGGVTVAGTFTFNPVNQTNAGSHSETGTFTSSNPNYASGGTATGTLIITAIAPVLSVTCTGGVYIGTAYPCTGAATGVGGATVTGTFAYNPGTETNVGSYPETGTFTSSNINYTSGGTAAGTLTITQATPKMTLTCPTVVFSGTAGSCTAKVTGAGNATVAGTTVIAYGGSPTAPSAVGSYAVVATFTSGDPNYVNGTGSSTLLITPAKPVITSLSPYNATVGGADFPLTVSGTDFEATSVIEWNGTQLTTTVSSDLSTLTATIPAADLAKVGTATVQVLNPAPGSSSSSELSAKFVFAIDSNASTTGSVTVTPSTTTLTVTSAAGGTVTLPVTAAGATSTASTKAACYNLPTGVTCSYANGTVTFNVPKGTPIGNYSITIVFTTTQTVASLFHGRTFFAAWSGILGLPLGLLWMGGNRKKNLRRLLMVLVGMVLLVALVGCGGSSTPASTSVLSQSSTSVTLQVQ